MSQHKVICRYWLLMNAQQLFLKVTFGLQQFGVSQVQLAGQPSITSFCGRLYRCEAVVLQQQFKKF